MLVPAATLATSLIFPIPLLEFLVLICEQGGSLVHGLTKLTTYDQLTKITIDQFDHH